MYDEVLKPKILPNSIEIKDPAAYYKTFHGSQLVFKILDEGNNLIARGVGMTWNENPQMTPVMEWGHRHSVEIVKGAMPPGQITIQTLYFMHLNDRMPTLRDLVNLTELTALTQVAEHEDPKLKGLILEAFEGCFVAGQSGNWNSSSLYLKQAQIMFRKRITGAEWLEKNPGLANAADNRAAYPASI